MNFEILNEKEFLSVGENYCSQVTKGEVYVKNKKINLVIKRSRSELEHELFKREDFFYKKLVPLYKKIAVLVFSNKRELFPKFFRSSVIRKNNKIEQIRICLNELTNYSNRDKHMGLNCDNLSEVLECLALFHAIGFVIKQHFSHYIVQVKKRQRQDIRNVTKDKLLAKYKDLFEKVENFRIAGYEDKWSTIVHNDLWTNNLMFSGSNSVRLIDFQFIRYDSCLRDFVYLICMSAQEKQVEVYKQIYLQNLNKNLKKINMYFEEKEFEIELKRAAIAVFPLLIKVLKFTLDRENLIRRLNYVQYVYNCLL